MIPFFFGTVKEPLFGSYHPASARPARNTGILLCNPFGHEAILAHRMYRVMADRLSRLGFPVLRFDYYATGDSSGDCSEATLGRWREDVLTASEELTDMAGVRRVGWVGLRLGATTATLASARGPANLSGLVLWDPVVDGRMYLAELRRAHLRLLAQEFPIPRPHPFDTRVPQSGDIDQALGFAIPPTLHEQISALNVGDFSPLHARRVSVLANPMLEDLNALKASLDAHEGSLLWIPLASDAWNSDTAMNSSVIPVEAMNAIIRCIEALP